MDDLIVIILTLIIAGVGVLGQMKKKKQAEATSAGQPNPSKSFWDLITEEAVSSPQMENADFEESDFEEEEIESVQDTEVIIQKPVYQFKRRENEMSVANYGRKKTKEKKMKSILKEDFSLRDAVIYSEILNRKYT